MSGKKYLIDTNVIVDLFVGNETIRAQIPEIRDVIVSVITIGELYFGAEKSSKREKHLEEINEFEDICTVLDVKNDTAKIYGKIKNNLKAKGCPIPENDIWIAATAIENDLTLITNDKHFKRIDGIKLKQIS